MHTWVLDAVVWTLRLVHSLVLPDLGVLGLMSIVAALATVALVAAVARVCASLSLGAASGRPPWDGIGTSRLPLPGWARPDAPGGKRTRAPSVASRGRTRPLSSS